MLKSTRKIIAVFCAVLLAVLIGASSASIAFAAGTVDESEDNNTYTTADALTAGTTMKAKLTTYQDVDFFKVQPTKNGKLTFTFGHSFYDSTNGWDLTYYRKNSDGTYSSIYSTTIYRSSVETYTSIPISVIANTIYLIKIACRSSYSGYYTGEQYSVSYSFTATEYYEREYNNTYTNATLIPASKEIEGNLETYNDADYYYCTPQSNGKLYFTFKHTFTDSSNGWDIEIYMKNSGGNYSIVLTETVYRSSSETLSFLPIGAKANTTYCIKVSCRSSYSGYYTSAQYFVSYSLEATEYFEREFNDSYETANALPSGIAYGGVMIGMDTDFYSFVSAKSGKLSLDFMHSYIDDSSRGWDVFLYYKNSGGGYSEISKKTVYLNSSETVSIPFDAVSGTTYCVKVMVRSDYSGYRTNRLYSIKCTYSSSVSSYTVTYNANGGSVSPTSATVTAGSSTTLPTPTKSYKITYNANNGSGAPSAQTVNLTCKGWATSSGATSASYNCGASYKPTASTTLYAVWTSPVSATLSSTKPTRSGYTFLGWSTSSSATSATYSAGGSISLSANATLYAVWKQNSSSSYTVTYNPNGGSVSPTSATVTAGSSVTLPTPTRSYTITYNANSGSGAPAAQTVKLTCKGWGESAAATAVVGACGQQYTPKTASKTLFAVWEAASATISSTKPTRSGYTFVSWNTQSDGTGTTYSPGGNYTGKANLTLYAIWKANPSSSYTVTYNPNGGSVAPTSTTITAGNSTTLPTPTKSYKITYNANNGSGAPSAQTVSLSCKGWATSSTATSANYSCGASYKPTASTTLYAVWTSPVSATLSSTKPARSGYTFLGWSTSSSATSATYSAGGNISLTGNATLYAVWSSNTPTPTNAGIQIRNYTPHREEAYRTTITFTAETFNAPAEATVHWYLDGRDVYIGNQYTVSQATDYYSIQAKLIGTNGDVLAESGVENVSIKNGFFARLIAFFRILFGRLPVIVQSTRDVL